MFKFTAAAAALMFAATALPTVATAGDRLASAEEAAAVGGALQAAGFQRWTKIELDDGKWEVDDAVHADGKIYDVDLSVADLRILKRDLED
ncbi:MAG: PepSY domain-containing protein [Hyphomicrobium sp.]